MNQVLLRERRDVILDLGRRHGARNVRVFGSVPRGDSGPDSDLDLLVDMDADRSLLDLVGLKQDLEEYLGCRVDVVTAAALSPYMRAEILSEAVPL